MTPEELLQSYQDGAVRLQERVAQVPAATWQDHPIAGTWSIAEVICHLADFEVIFATRMKQVLAEDNPPLPGADENQFAARLNYSSRDVAAELQLIVLQRQQIARILSATDLEDYQRTGVHSEAGPVTLETLLEKAIAHLQHHLTFVEQKVQAILAAG